MPASILLAAALAAAIPAAASPRTSDHHTIVHDIYIKLKDSSPAAIEKQLEIGRKYLSDHPGETSFTSAVVAEGLTRHQQVSYLVNDTDFDVAFHLRFKTAKDHDAYQTSERHVKGFIPLSSPNWVKIRVFDSRTE